MSSSERRRMIEAGGLIDVSGMARRVGIQHQVALSRSAWNLCVRTPEGARGHDEDVRLRDLLFEYRAQDEGSGPETFFQVVVRKRNGSGPGSPQTLRVIVRPNDSGETEITMSLLMERR